MQPPLAKLSPVNLPIGDIPRTSEAFLISGAFRAFRHHPVIKISHIHISPIYRSSRTISEKFKNNLPKVQELL